MKKLLCLVLTLIMLLPMIPVMAAEAPTPSPFEDGDVVALFGDSMTQGALYERFLLMYYATHHPDVDFEIVNFGHAGDTSIDLLDKVDRDLAFRSDITKAYIMIGANDAGGDGSKLSGMADRLEKIVAKIRALPSVKEVVLIAQTRYYGNGARADSSIQAAQITRDTAKKLNCPLVETDLPIKATMDKIQEKNPTASMFPDKLHPDTSGNLIIAAEIIKAQGLTPPCGKDLPVITINTQTNTADAKNATVDAVVQNGNSWSFTYTADRLPFPIMKGIEVEPSLVEYLTTHDLLQFVGLPNGSYTLTIDGTEVGTYSAQTLTRGLDLGNTEGSPIQERAKLVRRKVETLHNKTNSYMVLGHVGEYAALGIKKANPSLEEVTKAADAKLASGEIDATYHDSYINNKKNRESLYAELQSIRAEVKKLASDRTFKVTLTQKLATGVPQKAFADTENHWGKSYILPLAELSIINGKGEGTFDPDGQITRAEFLTLTLKVGNITPTTGEAYADVAQGAWFYNTVATAKRLGLIPEAMVADGNFYPDRNITREEMTAVLSALYEYQKPAVRGAEIGHFTDRASFSDWAVEPIAKAVNLGLVAGNPDGSFNAKGNATRAEAAVIMFRLLKLL